MSNSRNTLFTIGQFAALHGINKKTLMWYDEIGLFRPATVKDNGYRYYTYHQSSTLETILMLRELGMSLQEIGDFLQHRSASGLERLLDEKITELDRNLERMLKIRNLMVQQKEELADLLATDLSEISIIEKEEEHLVLVPTPKEAPLEKEIELVIAETKKYGLQQFRDASYGSVISTESLYRRNYEDYTGVFLRLPESVSKEGNFVRPKGKYLRAHSQGQWDNLPQKYEELLHFADEQGFTLCGYAYETGVNETVIQSMEEYITRIEIGITSK